MNNKPKQQIEGINFRQYAQPDYKQPNPTQREIDQAKQFIQSRDKKQMITQIASAVKKSLEDKGQDVGIQPLLEQFQKQNQTVLDALHTYEMALDANATSKQLGLNPQQRQTLRNETYQAENQFIMDKFGFMPSSENLQLVLDHFGIKDKISHKKLRELLIIDDWATVATWAWPYIQKYGKQAIDSLWEKYIGKNTFKDQDWGGPTIDQGEDPTSQMYKIARVPGMTYGPKMESFEGTGSGGDIYLPYIQALLLPEVYQGKLPVGSYAPSTLIQSSATYQINSNSEGNSFAWIKPWVPFSPADATGLQSQFFIKANPASYDPSAPTLSDLQTASGYAGPLHSLQNVMQYRLVGFSTNFVPTLSENNATGNVSLCSYYELETGINSQLVNPQTMASSTTFVTGNMRSVYRQAVMPTRLSLVGYYQNPANLLSNPAQESVQIIYSFAGAPPDTQIGVLYIYYVYEIRYQPAQVRYNQQTPGMYSPSTYELAVNITSNEALFMQNSNDIKKVLAPTNQPGKKWSYTELYQGLVTSSGSLPMNQIGSN